MRKVIILLFAVLAVNILNAQTLRMTTVHIDEQKVVNKHNNHILVSVGQLGYDFYLEHRSGESFDDYEPFMSIGYFRTGLFFDSKMGLYINGSLGATTQIFALTAGITYDFINKGYHNIYALCGVGPAFDSYPFKTSLVKIEAGALYSYKHFDVKLTAGYPEFFAAGIGINF